MRLRPLALFVLCLCMSAPPAVAQRPDDVERPGMRLPRGTLVVNCRLGDAPYPEGKIYVSGREWGKCPRASHEITAGTFSVLVGAALGNDRYLVYENERVEVRRNRTQEVTATLAESTGQRSPALAFALGVRTLSSFRLPLDSDVSNPVTAFSPDASLLAFGAETNSVRLYRVADGKDLGRLGARGEYWPSFVTALSFSADGRLLASSGWLYDKYIGEINLWDVSGGRLLRTIHGVEKVSSLALSPDGKLLAAGVAPNTIKLWDVEDGRLRWAIKPPGDGDQVNPLLFSADGGSLVSGHSGGDRIHVYDVRTAARRRTLPGRLVTLAGDGRVATYLSRDGVATQNIWRSLTGELTGSKQFTCYPSEFGLRERLIVCSDQLRDARDGRLLVALPGNPVALSADGRRLLLNVGDYVVLSLPELPGAAPK